MTTIHKEPFLGFTYRGIHSSRFNVYHISDGSRYNQTFSPEFNDQTETVPGFDGTYYFGTNMTQKTHPVNCFAENVTESQYRQLKNWLNPKVTGEIIMDETPYKAYKVKVQSVIDFPLSPTSLNGEIVYTGKFTINFVSYYPVYGYSLFNSLEEFNYDNPGLFYNSGILYAEYDPSITTYTNITSPVNILFYNGGNEKSKTKIYITGTWQQLQIQNNTTKQGFILKENNENVTFVVDAENGRVTVNDLLASEYHDGGYIELQGSMTSQYENVQFENGSNIITFQEDVILDYEIEGKYILLQGSQYKILSRISDNELQLVENFTGDTEEYDIVLADLNEISISGVGLNIDELKFEYRYTYL